MNKKQVTELKRLQKINNGLLSPELVVDVARDKKNPLHNQFTWDDSVAAHQYRLEQARRMIRICVTVISSYSEPVRMFVSLKSDRRKGVGYRSMQKVLSEDESRDELLRDALFELKLFQQKYRMLSELAKIFEEVDKVAVKVKQRVKATI